MKQVTGNSQIAETSRELSIQITLSGFSFSVSHGGKVLFGSKVASYDFESVVGDPFRYDSVFVGWNGSDVLLVPQELFDPAVADSYMHAANMVDPSTVTVFNRTLDQNIAAVWRVDAELMDSLAQLFPGAYHYHNLQVDVLRTDLESVRVSVVEDSMANVVVMTRDGLHSAETVAFDSAEDLLYFVSKVNLVDKFARHSLELIAADVEPYRNLFMRHFTRCTFTDNDDVYHPIVLKCE